MNSIFELIALPVTFAVVILCFLFAMLFEPSFRMINGVSVFKRVYRESNNLLLYRTWGDMLPLFKCLIYAIIYYVILF